MVLASLLLLDWPIRQLHVPRRPVGIPVRVRLELWRAFSSWLIYKEFDLPPSL